MYEHTPHYLIALTHVIATFVATASLFYGVFLMRKHKKEFSRFSKARVGDSVKFYMSCQNEDCIFNGIITDIKGPIVEIQADPNSHGWQDCDDCVGGLRKVNKPYQEVIF